LELDKDQNGMLSLDEIKAFTGFSGGPSGGGDQIQFTTTALTRLFEETITFQPCEMDYRGFVNLVLATENMASPESVRYFWKLVDFDKSGRLTAEKIKFFYKDIHACLLATNYDAPNPNHVALEIFDILACNDSRGPSLSDLITSKQGHTVLTMLLDVNGFWKYDNRESLMAQHASEEEEEEKPQPAPPPVKQPPRAILTSASSFAALNEGAYDDEDFESFDD
jgi:serine/threonine-protein phosphatase 2A regulatory subunit B''